MLYRSVKFNGCLDIDRNGAHLDLELCIEKLMWLLKLSQICVANICGVFCQAKDGLMSCASAALAGRLLQDVPW